MQRAVRTALALVRELSNTQARASAIRHYTRVGASHPANIGTSRSLPFPQMLHRVYGLHEPERVPSRRGSLEETHWTNPLDDPHLRHVPNK